MYYQPPTNSPQANVNHSCDPNMSLLNWRNTNVAVANRPIEAGEQLFDTYGALYYHMKTDDRKAYVKVSLIYFTLAWHSVREQDTRQILDPRQDSSRICWLDGKSVRKCKN